LTTHLRLSFQKNKKGVGTVFGMIFFLLILTIVLPSFLIILQQNRDVEEASIQTRQIDLDRADEQLTIINPLLQSPNSESVTLSCILNNTSPLVVHLVRLWVADTTSQTCGNLSLSVLLQQGEVQSFNRTVNLANSASDNFTFWFVSARGNKLPLTYPTSFINTTENNYYLDPGWGLISSEVGSVLMIYQNFSFYQNGVTGFANGQSIGAPSYSFTIPNSGTYDTIFKVQLLNLDPTNETIYLNSESVMWDLTPHASTVKSDGWNICNVTNGIYYTSYTPQALPWNQTVEVYFGPDTASFTAGQICPVNILIWGARGEIDYGQNIPFIGIKFDV